ncbi:Uncharacterized protein Rs2_02574 [Raphanus sativus]|nr:Uncharacterized protein Rs2_02574 [Raphanus sativus]
MGLSVMFVIIVGRVRAEQVVSSSSYDQNDEMLDDEIQGEEASEPCLAGKRRKETERSSSVLLPKPTKLIAHRVKKLQVGLKTRIVRILHVKELNVFWFHFVFDSA